MNHFKREAIIMTIWSLLPIVLSLLWALAIWLLSAVGLL